jgi:hypothetical protein
LIGGRFADIFFRNSIFNGNKGDNMGKENLLSSGAVAKELGVTPAKVKKLLEATGVAAAEKKCNCSYYDAAGLAKLKKALAADQKAAAKKK